MWFDSCQGCEKFFEIPQGSIFFKLAMAIMFLEGLLRFLYGCFGILFRFVEWILRFFCVLFEVAGFVRILSVFFFMGGRT